MKDKQTKKKQTDDYFEPLQQNQIESNDNQINQGEVNDQFLQTFVQTNCNNSEMIVLGENDYEL